jgi:hypothetical protein
MFWSIGGMGHRRASGCLEFWHSMVSLGSVILKPYFVKIAELSLLVKSAREWRESEVGILKNIDRVGLGFIERACGRSHGVNPVTSRRRDTQGWVRGHGRGEMFYIRLPVRGVGATAV